MCGVSTVVSIEADAKNLVGRDIKEMEFIVKACDSSGFIEA